MSFNQWTLKGPFRSKNGLILGVLRGLAEHWQISPFTVRVLFIIAGFFLAFWPLPIIYVIAAIIMPSEPKLWPKNERQKELLLLGQADPQALVEHLTARFDSLEKKARRLEDIVTSKAYRTN
ncbi:MAG: PspC domain-containing protein [Deltaproteobacteria bacterium]|jgi:phage shock protein C|nr:PspC domain-containing protein [Deltaproteobacteria bacterium]